LGKRWKAIAGKAFCSFELGENKRINREKPADSLPVENFGKPIRQADLAIHSWLNLFPRIFPGQFPDWL
jgi:hypothetical protein